MCIAMAIGIAMVSTSVGSAPAQTTGWRPLAPWPDARSAVSAGSVGGDLYLVGGRGPWDPVSQTYPILDAVDVYDPVADSWRGAAPYPIAAYDVALAASGSSLFGVGGRTSNDGFSRRVYRLDPGSGTWTEVASMPRSMNTTNGGILTGWRVRIWRLGTGDSSRGVDVYLPLRNRWVPRPKLPPNFLILAAAASGNGRPYVFVRHSAGHLLFALSYVRRSHTWVSHGVVPRPSGLRSWYGISAATGADGRIYIVGGSRPLREFGSIAYSADNRTVIYDPVTGRWSNGSPPPTQGLFPAVADLGNLIVAVGGVRADSAGIFAADTAVSLDTSP
jgi:hypothetical protein